MAAKFHAFSEAASGEVIAAVASHRIRVLAFEIVAAGAVTLQWVSDTAAPAALSGVMTMATGIPFRGTFHYGVFQTATGKNLGVVLGAGIQVSGWVVYEEVFEA